MSNGILVLVLSASLSQLSAGDHSRSVDVAGTSRAYNVHIPPGYQAGTPTPLVLIFHGYGESAKTMAEDTGLNDKADAAGFIALYPDGSGNKRGWNAGRCCTAADDVEFVKLLLEDVSSVVNVDQKRVYAVGMSNGAMLTDRLACEMSDQIAAIATVAGTRTVDSCSPTRAVPVIHFHGTKDRVIPFNGSTSQTAGSFVEKSTSVEDHIKAWVKHNKSDNTPEVSALSSGLLPVTQKIYKAGASGSAEVVLIEVKDGGHLWPGRPRPTRYSPEVALLLGETTQTVSANDLIWSFFKAH